MRVDKKTHLNRRWRVDEIAGDFHLWDIWEFPIEADNSDRENFQVFYRVLFQSLDNLRKKISVTGFLFSLRHLIGKVIPLDKNINSLPVPGCSETSLVSRLSDEDRKKNRGGKPIKDEKTGIEFLSVYLMENESLFEISNNTVHALLHIGWFRKTGTSYSSTLAVYVKPRGFAGRLYLKLIEPFRHYLVYPMLLKAVKKEWEGCRK